MTDSDLLYTYAHSGSEGAFAEVVRRNIGAVYSSALRRVGGDTSLAMDVTQSVFIALARKASAAAGHPLLSAWLYIAVRNEAANVVRSERRRRTRERHAAILMSDDSQPSAEPNWDQLAAVLDESIDELNEEDRRVVLMRFMNKNTFPDIAASLGIAEDAARMRVSRALDRLRTFLQRRGIVSTSTALAATLTENAVGAVPQGLVGTVVSGVATSAWATAGGLGATLAGLLLSPLTAFVAVAAVAVAAATYEARQAALAEAQLSTQRLALQAARDTIAADQRRAAASAQMRQPLASGLSMRSASPGQNHDATDERAIGLAFMARHPQVKQAFEGYEDAQTKARYGALFGQLQLSADQIHRFEELMRFGMGFSEVSTELGPLTLTNETQDSYNDVQTKLQALLGAEGYQSFVTYNSALQGRQLAASLATMLAESDAPLTSAQAQQMSGVFSSAGDSNKGSFDWGSVAVQAQGILSSPQLAQLDELRVLRQSWAAAIKSNGP